MEPDSFKQLLKRQQEGNQRQLRLPVDGIDFYSNDYLGLSKLPSAAQTGSTGSRLISGHSPEAERCENFLATFFKAEAALVFGSGYEANVGLFSCVATRHDTYIYDAEIHASVRDGIRMSAARAFAFRHQDLSDLEKKLKQATGDVFVAVEGLYSMDGTLAPLKELAALQQQYGFYLIVDEAHSGGVYGAEGRGWAEACQVLPQVFARVITFGKAYGSHGAAVLGSSQLKTYLINFAHSLIYTTAPAPQHFLHLMNQVQRANDKTLQMALQKNIKNFVNHLGNALQSDADSPIQVIRKPIPQLHQMVAACVENQLAVKLILSPTVRPGNECVRICIHAFNTDEQVQKLAKIVF